VLGAEPEQPAAKEPEKKKPEYVEDPIEEKTVYDAKTVFDDMEKTVYANGDDATIRERSENWDFSRLSLVDRNIMRIAVFEMLFLPEVPPVVSINEAVEIAIDFSGERAGSFMNGVLNGIKDTLTRPPREAVEKL